jgi:hypothetical protein
MPRSEDRLINPLANGTRIKALHVDPVNLTGKRAAQDSINA